MGCGREGPPRKTRRSWNAPGHAHEVTFSCQNRWQILSSPLAKEIVLRELDQARHRLNFALVAYVVMPEHVHLLIKPNEDKYSMARILLGIKSPSSRSIQRFLRKTRPEVVDRLRVERAPGRVEYRVWLQGGGYDRNIDNREDLATAIDYLHSNPVRRGFVGAPDEWSWSSAHAYLGTGDPPIPVDFIDW